jgi:hypothetical protein
MAFTVRKSGSGFAVFDGSVRISGVLSRVAAQYIRDRMVRAAERPMTLRACLCCGASFESEGPHNRMCNTCRRRAEPFPMLGGIKGRPARRPFA